MSFEEFSKNMKNLNVQLNNTQAIIKPEEKDEDFNSDGFVELIPNQSKVWYYKPVCFILTAIFVCFLIGTFGYALIQFEFCTTLRPAFINSWINSLDKTTLPLIFHDNQKHPVVLTLLWFLSVRWVLKGLISLEALDSPFYYLDKIKTILLRNLKYIILGTVFLFIMSKPYVYKAASIYFAIEAVWYYLSAPRGN